VRDAQVLLRLLRGQPRRGTLAERLEAFYAPQAEHYDAFRKRLLHGRAELMGRLDPRPGDHVVELGAGPDYALSEHRAPVPYLPGLRVPYYVFVGRLAGGG
jgi:S-adenosylmethionine-diacylgycerolhomoserine-N-methlytransferase